MNRPSFLPPPRRSVAAFYFLLTWLWTAASVALIVALIGGLPG